MKNEQEFKSPYPFRKLTDIFIEMLTDYKELQSGDLYKYVNRFKDVTETSKLKQARNLIDYTITEREGKKEER